MPQEETTPLRSLKALEASSLRILPISQQPQQQIPGFQILEKLGAGAMATVFKAKQINLDRIVAIKVLPKRYAEDTEFVERFYREGRAAAALNHPNIVGAYDVGLAGKYHYFIMEYVDGSTVYDELAKGKVYTEKEALEVIVPIARALEHAHEKNLIHRDVKPKNIMLTTKRIPKLADLGLARNVTDVTSAQAEKGKAFGTPYYISPEQIRGELDIDFRTDIYGLGATLYHMVTGRVPFDGETVNEVMTKHLKTPLTPPDHFNMNLSSGLSEIVEVMMAKKRQDRYRTTRDLIVDLELVAKGEQPLQAHKHIDTVLTDLAKAEQTSQTVEPQMQPMVPSNTTSTTSLSQNNIIILLSVLLGLSVLGNLIQLVW